MVLLYINQTHAYYSSESGWVPIFTGKVGNFTGKGDTSPITDKNTDINVLYYVQNGLNLKKYDIYNKPPLDVKNNYKLDEEKSNCIPKETEGATYSDYSIDENTGKVTINVEEDTPKQVVCRIYYSFNIIPHEPKEGDVRIIIYQESDTGSIADVRNGKYYVVVKNVSSGYTMKDYECDNKDNVETEVEYRNNKITYITTGKNTCKVYFDKQ